MAIYTTKARRPSWRGILAGLLMGLVVSMIMLALALVLSSFLSLDLRGAGIAAGIYAAVTALLSAFVAGFFAVKASAPEALFGDGTDILPKDATLTGILTAAAIVVITSFFAINSVSGIVRTAGNAVGTTASAIGGAVSAVTSTAATVAGAAATNSDGVNITDRAQELYQKATGNISRQDIEAWVAKNNDTFDQAQIGATVNVLEGMLNKTKADLVEMDFTNLDTWKNIDQYAKQRADEVEGVLKGQELVNRLQAEGLSQAQAVEVQQETLASYHEYRAATEQAVADARVKMEQALQTAEETARKAALYSGLFWLISTLLTFLASIAGARTAAANYRLSAAPVVLRDEHK
ncbi:hypothetical protein MOVS_00125 [Moraxella ovis]|uniref:Permease of the major facilitator superfamily n=1 Tax=Moraxella ovis TaxID=29433 RepID=A0A378PGW4_9GAMM|nr:YrzE family protein [Moraxella ovis]ANB90674.1 hypothetical protein MOVS_00125 [Moraxella ovis]STY86064.1 Uncharacterised protein [Moraxella ovis]